jgi:alkyl sulfatase BDS1-like metallo-beta-lactamase superfamily hydrolase
MLQYTPIERFLEAMAASLNGPNASEYPLRINLTFTDLNQNYVLHIENGVLHFQKAPPNPQADAGLALTKAFFLKMMTGEAGPKDLLLSDQTKISGSQVSLIRFFSLIEKPPKQFPVVTR